MPGIKIISPMTPKEYEYAYERFMSEDDVYYVSEHRKSYDNSTDLLDVAIENCDVVLFPISITRFEAEKARNILWDKGIKASIFHQLWIKPFSLKKEWSTTLNNSKYGGIVLDDDYDDGVAKSIAHKIMMKCDRKVYTLGLDDRTAGFHESVDILPPTAEKIVHEVERIISLA